MDQKTLQLIAFLLFATIYTLIYGSVTRWFASSKLMNAIANFVMRYSRSEPGPITAYTVWFVYLIAGAIGSVVLLLWFRVDLWSYFSLVEPKYLVLVPIGLIAQFSLSSVILMTVAAARPRINWFAVLLSVKWISISTLLPRLVGVLYPFSGAFFEELFFRGAIFIILVNNFPQLGFALSIVICTALFTIQQMLQTDTIEQRFMLATGSVAISITSCILLLHTGSFLPGLICHELYALLFLAIRQPANSFSKVPSAALNTASKPSF